MPRSHVTIRDVARHAGVSHQTVSRVINGSTHVSPETLNRVEASISELGYSPNAIARFMATGRTGVLVCLAPNLTDYTFASIIESAQGAAREQGYFLMSASAASEKIFGEMMQQFVASQHTEGIMVINPYADGRYQLLPTNFPIVFAGARPREEAVSSVALDDFKIAFMATQHLIGLGHQHIALITGPMTEDCSQDRFNGYQSAMQEAHLDPEEFPIIEGNWSPTSGYDAFMHLLQEGQRPTAVFAQNDQMAIGVMRAAREIGIPLPEKLSIIGIDDIPLAAYLDPPLTTIRQDFSRIGRDAAHLLINAIENHTRKQNTLSSPSYAPQHLKLPAELICRRSTVAPHTP